MSHDAPELIRLVAAFEDTSLPKEAWTHAAHVTVALHYVTTRGEAAALASMRANVRRFNAAKGGPPTAYHETITCAWIALLGRFLEAHTAVPAADRQARALAAFDRAYLFRFYTRERLLSDEARAAWVPPDVAPLAWAE